MIWKGSVPRTRLATISKADWRPELFLAQVLRVLCSCSESAPVFLYLSITPEASIAGLTHGHMGAFPWSSKIHGPFWLCDLSRFLDLFLAMGFQSSLGVESTETYFSRITGRPSAEAPDSGYSLL